MPDRPDSTEPACAVPPRPTKTPRRRANRGTLKDAPAGEHPRDRLLHFGANVLSDAELLAVLFHGNGHGGGAVIEAARAVLEESGGFAGLIGAQPADFQHVSAVKAAALVAAVEVACRIAQCRVPDREPLERPADVARYLSLRYPARDQEVVGALFLDSRNRLLAEKELFRGGLSRVTVEARQVLREALLRGAAALLIFHNHPSGDPTPSTEDLLFTRRMAEAGEVVGVRLVDHMILGTGGRWVSLHQRGAC